MISAYAALNMTLIHRTTADHSRHSLVRGTNTAVIRSASLCVRGALATKPPRSDQLHRYHLDTGHVSCFPGPGKLVPTLPNQQAQPSRCETSEHRALGG